MCAENAWGTSRDVSRAHTWAAAGGPAVEGRAFSASLARSPQRLTALRKLCLPVTGEDLDAANSQLLHPLSVLKDSEAGSFRHTKKPQATLFHALNLYKMSTIGGVCQRAISQTSLEIILVEDCVAVGKSG